MPIDRAHRAGRALLALTFAALGAGPLTAQTDRIVPTNEAVLTGYGTVGYAFETQGENANAFTSAFNPIFLFQFQDRVLFEAEFEFELQGGITETGLEYAQLDFLLTDNLTLVGGKFLVPFGVFGERLHPSWINKFPTAPPLYGHHVAAFGTDPLLPILSDVGLMARGVIDPANWHLALNAYAVQGPAPEDPAATAPAELVFPASSGDNNTDKMFGGRLDIAMPPWFEVNVSYLSGDYDDNNVLDLTGWNIAGELHVRSFELRGEYVQTRQEIETLTGFPVVVRDGFYAQAAYRWNAWEPVLRWTQVFDTELNGQVLGEGAWQAGIGLDYWFNPSIAVMAGYELNREDGPAAAELDNDRFVIHVAFGF